VADIFRRRGLAWRASHAGQVSLGQRKVMSAIERCRTWAFSPRARPVGALGGHVERCEACAHLRICYNSCRNRHCPKCQAAAAKEWLADRQAELLPVPYFHVVFILPGAIADIAYQNQAVVYDLLLKAAAETLITIAADPKHLGARIGLTAVLHTWGSALTHHPHAHIIVPGGGLSPKPTPAQAGGQHWIACRPGFFLSVRVLSRLFRRLCLERLTAAYQTGRLEFFADQAALAEPPVFNAHLGALRKVEWVVYAKPPFGGPDAVLAYLSRYTHRIPDPRAARRVPSHPALRPLRQCQPGRQYRIGPPAPRRTRHSSLERRQRSRGRWSRRRRTEYLSLLRRAYGHRRDLRARLPAATVAQSNNRLRQLMTSALPSPSHIAAPVPGRYLIADGYPPPTVSAAFDRQNAHRSRQDHRSDPAHRDQTQRRRDYSTVVPGRNRKIRPYTGAKSP
jgi:hypothetical protein